MSKKTNFKDDFRLYRRLLAHVMPYRWIFLASILGFALFAAMDVLAADVMQYLIDSMGAGNPVASAASAVTGQKSGLVTTFLKNNFGVNPNDSSQARIFIPLTIMALALMRGVGAFIGNYCIKSVGSRVVYDLRQVMFEKMMHLPASYILSRSSGSLISRITFSVGQITHAVTNALTIFFREGMTVLFLAAYLIYINWQLTLTFVAVAPFIGLVVSNVSRRFRRISRKMQATMGDVTHVVSEAVNGNRDMRIYGAQTSEIERFKTINKKTRSQQLKMASADAAFSPTVQILLSVAICMLVWLGLSPSVVESMSPGLFVSYLIAAGVIGKPLRQLTSILNSIQKALAASEEIFATLDEPVEIETGTREINRARGEIRFENVTFRYPNAAEDTLKGIDFNVNAGEMVALVGASGGGKSTIASLIPRFFNVTSGEIYIDNIPMSELTLASLRKQIAFVSQNVVLMNDSVRNNIAYGELANATDEEVRQAAMLANAHEFIEKMDQGYNTVIGDNGLRLSGGQRQRLAIARAILKNAPILIMDEATSALDNESERLIQQALQNIANHCTCIVIAHRLSTIERADRILVIDQGEIVESGTHTQLLAMQGRYAQLHDQYSTVNVAQSDAKLA